MTTAEKLDEILDILDSLVHAALSPMRYEEIARHQVKLGQVLSRTQLILSFIDSHEAHHDHR